MRSLKPKTAKFLLALASVLVALALVEGLFRLFGVADPPLFRPDADYGYLMQANQWVSTRGLRFHINRDGLRGDDIILPKPAGILRVVFLGDSITYGGGSIDDEHLFVNRVAAALTSQLGRRVEAVNISAPGWGIENIAQFLAKRGTFQSDLVVWVIPSVDFRRPKSFLGYHTFPTRKPRLRSYYLLRVAWQRVSQRIMDGIRRPAPQANTHQEFLLRNLDVLRSTLTDIRSKGTPAAVIFIPGTHGFDQAADLAQFEQVTESCGVPFLNTAPVFQQQTTGLLFLDSAHPAILGHKLVADATTQFLAERFFKSGKISSAK